MGILCRNLATGETAADAAGLDQFVWFRPSGQDHDGSVRERWSVRFALLKKLRRAFLDLVPIILVIAFFQLFILRQPFPELGKVHGRGELSVAEAGARGGGHQ